MRTMWFAQSLTPFDMCSPAVEILENGIYLNLFSLFLTIFPMLGVMLLPGAYIKKY